MTNKAWTYHEFHHSPRRKTYSVMEGIRVVAACNREKDAGLIVSMKATNAGLVEALKSIETIVMGSKAQMENQIRFAWRTARQAIAKAEKNES